VNNTIRIPDEDFNGMTGFTYLSWKLHTMAYKNVRQQDPIAEGAARTVRPLRLPNKAAETKLVDTSSAGVRILDSVEDLGFSLRPFVHRRAASERSSDDDDDNDGDRDSRWTGHTLDDLLHIVLQQFVSDIFAKGPNIKSSCSPSICVLSPERRYALDHTVMKRPDLLAIWDRVHFSVADVGKWKDMFDLFFPAKKWKPGSSAQNWKQCTYVHLWDYIRDNLAGNSERAMEACRDVIRTEFREFRWIPAATRDRIWFTTSKNGWRTEPAGGTKGARVYLNGQYVGETHFRM
jgi:hypothetical protein